MHTAIPQPLIFLSDKEHQGIEHVSIDLVVQCKGCCLYMQDGILPFVESIEADLQKVQDKHAQNKDPGGACSYSLLIANYGGIMAVPTDPPYCLVYPTVYNTAQRTRITSKQQPIRQGCTHAPASVAPCFSTQTWNQSAGEPEGSHLIPHGIQYRTLFPEIAASHNQQELLIDHNTGEPYPMVAAGDFCLMDPIFPGSPGDSLLFKEDDLA